MKIIIVTEKHSCISCTGLCLNACIMHRIGLFFYNNLKAIPYYFFLGTTFCRNFPQGCVSDMVTDVSTGIGYVCQNIESFGGDPSM